MANVKAAEMRDMDEDALLLRWTEAKAELFNLRFQLVTGQLDNSARVTLVRREIARILTELRAREITAAEALAEEHS
jgi:large subunit ribosomal protein L29